MCVFNKEVPEIPWFSISRLARKWHLRKIIVKNHCGKSENLLRRFEKNKLKVFLQDQNSLYQYKFEVCYTMPYKNYTPSQE